MNIISKVSFRMINKYMGKVNLSSLENLLGKCAACWGRLNPSPRGRYKIVFSRAPSVMPTQLPKTVHLSDVDVPPRYAW